MARTTRRIIIADTPEELDALTAQAAQDASQARAAANIPRPPARPPVEPGPAPGTPNPPVITPTPPTPNDPETGDDDPIDPDGDGIIDDDDPDTVRAPTKLPPAGNPPEPVHAGSPAPAQKSFSGADGDDLRRSLYTEQRHREPLRNPILEGQVLGHPLQKYESRITVVEAWQYAGQLGSAPDFVDKNWLGYAQDDTLRQIPAGPCLRVPTGTGDEVVCRIGDYIVQQEVKIDSNISDLRIEVWAKEHFQKMFLPTMPEQVEFA